MLDKKEIDRLKRLYEEDPYGRTLSESEKTKLIEKFDRILKLVLIKVGNHAPLWRGLVYTCKYIASFDLPTAKVNILRQIYINPLLFLSSNVQQQAFIVTHEVGHLGFNHLLRMSEYTGKFREFTDKHGVRGQVNLLQLANIAADYALNWMINESLGFTKDSCYPTTTDGKVWVLDKEEYRGLSLERILVELLKLLQDGKFKFISDSSKFTGNNGKGNEGNNHENKTPIEIDGIVSDNFDSHDVDTKGLSKEEIEKAQIENEVILRNAVNYARQRGNLPEYLERILSDLLEPKINWLEVLRNKIARSLIEVSGHYDYSWQRPNRRLIHRNLYLPTMVGRATNFILGLDTSGSMDQFMLDAVTEIYNVINQFPNSNAWLISNDCEVKEVQKVTSVAELDSTALTRLTKGGGGTSITPIFEYIRENLANESNLVIIITDGKIESVSTEYADFDTIWVIIDEPNFIPNFGEAIHLKARGAPTIPQGWLVGESAASNS